MVTAASCQHGRARGVALLSAVVAIAVSLVVPTPAQAAAPTQTTFEMTTLNCEVADDFGFARLNVSYSDTGAGFPGGDIVVWAPGDDPDVDWPLYGGFEEQVNRDGSTLTGQIPLRASGDGGGQGLDGDGESVGTASYDLTFVASGPSTTEVLRNHIVFDHRRLNQRFRSTKTRTPLVGSGTLVLPDQDPIDVQGCTGQQVREAVTITAPSTIVGAARYPTGFECTAQAPGATALLSLTGGELAVVVFDDASEEPAAIGSAFTTEKQGRVSVDVPMFDYATGDELGTAALRTRLERTARQIVRNRTASGVTTLWVETLGVTGSLVLGDTTYALEPCEGLRVRQHDVSH